MRLAEQKYSKHEKMMTRSLTRPYGLGNLASLFSHTDVSDMYKQTLPVPTNMPLTALSAIARTTCLKAMVLLITLPMTFAPAFLQAEEAETFGFSATLEHRFKPLQQSLMRSDVIVSEHGYRVQSQDEGLNQVVITNMVTGNIWFVDDTLSMVHELPLTRVEGVPKFPLPMVRLPGFIDSVPCFGQDGTQAGEVVFNDQQLQRWRCTTTDTGVVNHELPVEQYYSEILALVLYSRSANGVESQLLNIKRHQVDNQLFSPPEGLRSVGIEEFMGITPPIGTYQDAARR